MARALAIALTAFLMVTMLATVFPLFVSAAETEDTYLTYPISDIDYAYDGYNPIPMLVMQLSFDADGDGVDDNPDGSGESAVKDKNSASYGEQWCHTKDEDWQKNLFNAEGASLRTYYEYMTYGGFYFKPAEETYGTVNDGIIHLVLNNKHPDVVSDDGQWFHCFKQAIEAASEYVDFSVFDANKNGRVDTYELGLCFIIGGYEDSSSNATMSEPFGFHAYYKSYVEANSITVDNVHVGNSGFFCCGAISGGHALNFGVFAHELGHYLGAPDLYDYGSKYDNAISTLSLMASAAHGTSPAHIDAWDMLLFGFYDETIATNGEYTLYAKGSDKGEYNILKICTPNPGEYYLIENRWSVAADKTDFDDASAFHFGLVIYHVDDNIYYKTGDRCNTYEASSPIDPAVIAYHPSAMKICGLSPVAFTEGKDWVANTYIFPESKTWYTSMTAEEAAVMQNLKVEIVSELGHEIKVKISGADYVPNMTWVASATNETVNSFTVAGRITNLATATLNNLTIKLAEKSTGKEISTQQVKVKADGTFSVDYTGLTQNTTYTYTITADTSNGEVKTETNAYTAVGEIKKTNYTISAYRNLTDNDTSPRSIKVNLGEKMAYSFPMTKSGYAFMGWYLDPEFTKPFDLNFTQDEAIDFSIYAKWVPATQAATLKLNGATAQNKIFSVLPGEKFTEPVVAPKDGYEFEGWFADAEFTTPFDFSAPVTQTGNVTVYAKWKNLNPETTPEPVQTTTAAQTTEPVGGDTSSGNMTVVIIVVAAVVVLAGAAGIAVVIIKKKKS